MKYSTMSRQSRERRRLADERWPNLSNILACFFNEDYDLLYGSLEGAFSAAAQDGNIEYRRSILKEWRDWNMGEGSVDDIRPFLKDAFSIAIRFKEPIDARNFMNKLYETIITTIKYEINHKNI